MCVLVVEDELVIRMDLAITLEDAGHEVLCACDGLEALAMVARHPRPLTAILTDFNMPGGMTGADVIAGLRADYPAIPMFIVTARLAAVMPEFLERHRVGIVGKPYDAFRLVERLALTVAGKLDWRGARNLDGQA